MPFWVGLHGKPAWLGRPSTIGNDANDIQIVAAVNAFLSVNDNSIVRANTPMVVVEICIDGRAQFDFLWHVTIPLA